MNPVAVGIEEKNAVSVKGEGAVETAHPNVEKQKVIDENVNN